MQISELRIGNIVDIDGKGVMVNCVDRHGINREYVQYEGDVWIAEHKIKPAILTAERLKKFGFKVGTVVNDATEYYIDDFYLWERSGKIVFQYDTDYERLQELEFKHVHTLQNFYRILKGKELVILP